MFAAPLGLLALLAIPAIALLHVFRRRFQPQRVSALFLWADTDRTPLAGRQRETLKSSLSLLAECLAALCLALAFAGLRGCGDRPGEHLVAVLDASASMSARGADGSSAERALAELRTRIDALAPGSRVTLVASGAHPSLLAGPAAFPDEALDRLRAFEPRAQRHELSSAIAFALQVSGGARVVVFTDRYEPDRMPPEVELVAVGEPLDNVAFTHSSRERVRERATGNVIETAFVTLANLAPRTAQTTVTIAAADSRGTPLAPPRALTLAPHERRSLSWTLPANAPPVVVTLSPDALAIDDEAWLAPPPARTLALHAELELDDARRLGLASGEDKLGRLLAVVDGCVESASADTAHLVFARAVRGGAASWCLALEAPGTERKDWIGPFLFERRHPLLDGLTLEGCVWSADPALALDGVPLVSAGNVPLLVETELGARRIFRLNFDPARSTLARSPDWPILLANLCELRRRSLPGPNRTNLAVGDTLEYRAGGAVDETRGPLVFAHTDAAAPERRFPPRATIVIDDLEQPGLYTLRQGDAELARVAVSFADEFESDLTTNQSGRRPGRGAAASVDAEASWTEALLLVLAVLAIFADWFVLRRTARATTRTARREPRGLPAS